MTEELTDEDIEVLKKILEEFTKENKDEENKDNDKVIRIKF